MQYSRLPYTQNLADTTHTYRLQVITATSPRWSGPWEARADCSLGGNSDVTYTNFLADLPIFLPFYLSATFGLKFFFYYYKYYLIFLHICNESY